MSLQNLKCSCTLVNAASKIENAPNYPAAEAAEYFPGMVLSEPIFIYPSNISTMDWIHYLFEITFMH